MIKQRKNARTIEEIAADLAQVLAHARPGLTHIHLLPCDLKVVEKYPGKFDVTKQPDGQLVRVHDNRLIQVVVLE